MPTSIGETSALWSNSHSSHSMAIETPVESVEGEILKTDSTRPSVPPGHPMVDQQGQFTKGSPSRDHRCGVLPVHRQQYSGLGCPLAGTNCINVLELQAIWLGLRAFSQRVENARVALMSDNTSAVAFLRNQGGTKSLAMSDLATDICVFREEGNVTSSPLSSRASECVSGPSVQEGSNPQDRVEPKPDRSRQVFRAWGRPFVDLFALGKNTKLAICVSPIREETSWKVDSLVQNWNGLYAYAYPPTSLIRACLSKVRTENVEIVLIAPGWPNQKCFPDLLV